MSSAAVQWVPPLFAVWVTVAAYAGAALSSRRVAALASRPRAGSGNTAAQAAAPTGMSADDDTLHRQTRSEATAEAPPSYRSWKDRQMLDLKGPVTAEDLMREYAAAGTRPLTGQVRRDTGK